jgi:drug/metabolite transporter (DMT)-like permease
MGIQKSSIWIWTLAMNTIMLIMSLPDLYKERTTMLPRIWKYWKILFIIVCLHAIIYLSQMYVVSEIIAPYTTAFKSASSLFAVILGGWFFQEQNLMRRLIGALIIFSGILAIVFLS